MTGVVPDERSEEGVRDDSDSRALVPGKPALARSCAVRCMFGLEISSSSEGKAPPNFIFWPKGQKTPRAGESDAENREPLLTDFPEGFT